MSEATPPADVSAQPPRRFRRLRIGVSVFFGVLAISLCVLWVTSYWRVYAVTCPLPRHQGSIASAMGVVAVGVAPNAGGTFKIMRRPVTERTRPEVESVSRFGFGLVRTPARGVVFPIWLSILGSIASSIWVLRGSVARQFSLRSLLITTTLVAVLLGLLGSAVR